MNAGRPTATRLHWWWIGGATLALGVSITIGVMIGAVALSPGDVVRSVVSKFPGINLESGLSERDEAILWQIRMPRVILGVLVGSMLSAAGSAYQGVFRNPLADPYLLGAGAGAGLGATLAIAYGPNAGAWIIDQIGRASCRERV